MDAIKYETEEQYIEDITTVLDVLEGCLDGTVAGVYSHVIGPANYGITTERLELFIHEALKRGFTFYTYKELQ